MADSVGYFAAAQPQDLIELRLLVELAAVRELADRGLRDEEVAATRQQADATMQSARCRDVRGYLDADMAFHTYLLGLTGDPALLRIARLLLSRTLSQGLRGEDSGQLMAAGASDHAELVSMLADELASQASDLLRQHVARSGAGQPAPVPTWTGQNQSVVARAVTWPIE